jgi:hypothetical protein
LSRALGAGFGIGTVCAFGVGTVCAEDGVTAFASDAATSTAQPVRMPRIASSSAIRNFGFLFNGSSCLAFGPFIVLLIKADIVFP